MKTFTAKKLKIALCTAFILFVSVPLVQAKAPENAALLYYQAFLLYKNPDNTMEKMLSEFRDGKIESNEIIEQHIKENRRVIDYVIAAVDTPNCDWGYDYSQGMGLMMPNLAHIRKVNYLILTEAKLLAEQGDYKTAMDRCLSAYKMALHAIDKLLPSYLVGIGVSNRVNKSIQGILADMPEDLETLNWVKAQLVEIESNFPSLQTCYSRESEIILLYLRKENTEEILETLMIESSAISSNTDPTAVLICTADEAFFERDRGFYMNYIAGIQAVLDTPMPFVEAYVKLQELGEKMEKECKEKEAPLTLMVSPAADKIYSVAVRKATNTNATKAALEIYTIKAKTGKLPDELPAGLPGDLFSGKDFEYEKAVDGFILRCQGKDLGRDETYEYEFKVKK